MRPQVIDVNDMEIRDVGWQQRERPDRRRRRSRSRNRPRSTLVDLVVRRTYQCGSCCSRCLAVRFRTSFTYLSLSLSLKSAVDRGRSSGRFGGAGRSRRLPRAPAFLCGTEHSNRSEVETKMKRRTKKKENLFVIIDMILWPWRAQLVSYRWLI